MFDRLIHADWSMDPKKRWAAGAECRDGRWTVAGPRLVGDTPAFLDRAFEYGEHDRVLLGFDFPIGFPVAYGVKTDLSCFKAALPVLGTKAWSQFFDVGSRPEDVSIRRPFYPQKSTRGVSRGSLVSGLGIASFDDLLRVCERRTDQQAAACSLFWTLGGNQVGKGAISGWKEIVCPALQRGARLWPFDGSLAELAAGSGVVLAETYPALAYRMVGAGFLSKQSKRRQADRQLKAGALHDWAARHGIAFAEDAKSAIESGFGSSSNGEDQFDAFLGLLKMIEVADGRRREATGQHEATKQWEGWILGR